MDLLSLEALKRLRYPLWIEADEALPNADYGNYPSFH